MLFNKGKTLFVETIKLGEQVLGLSFSDYNDAYTFSEKNYSEVSKHFIEHFAHHSNEKTGTYEKDVIRYNYIKAIENRISSDIYANTPRGNVCDTLRSPFDIHLSTYPANLPKHLETIVNSFQKDADKLAGEVIAKILPLAKNSLNYQILNAIQYLGNAFGYRVGQKKLKYKGYKCCDMLTRDEISSIAGKSLCNWLQSNGYAINGASYTREPCLSIMATRGSEKILVGFSAEVAPTDPGFIKEDLDELF